MSQQILENGAPYGVIRNQINDNFSKLFDELGEGGNLDEINSQIAKLQSYVGYTEGDIYGLEAKFNNMEEGIFAANELGAELVRVMLEQKRALNMVTGETGTVTLTNTLAYPFNNSDKSVTIAAVRDTTDYTVEVDTGANNAGVGRVIVYDKLKNGFKIAFTGGAASVTVKYTVRGGLM